MIGVFVRSDLPEGDQKLTGHGYSVALVRCRTRKQLRAVTSRLSTTGLPEPFNHPYPWYGGRMDFVASVPGMSVSVGDALELQPRISVGDHRFIGFYDAEELL